jgi:UDP-N-acetylglucosamine 2-epimerase (non-hydrolysing)
MSATPVGRCRIDLVAGTRPNVMKIAPLYNVLSQQSWCAASLTFIRQHFSANMSDDLFQEFGIRDAPAIIPLEAGEFGQRLGAVISAYSAHLQQTRPDVVVVPGDVDAALGAALAAKRLHLPLVHLEAGLRSHDPTMPEEINRCLIDRIADLLLAPSEAAAQNLIFYEGNSHTKVKFVGNIMIDALRHVVSAEKRREVQSGLGVRDYCVATFHRPANVDDPGKLGQLCRLIEEVSSLLTVVLPLHPRTRSRIEQLGRDVFAGGRVIVTEPMAYSAFVNLVSGARFVMTDSGGVQEETSFLNVGCFTVRDTTERPITVYQGTNTLVTFEDLLPQIRMFLDEPPRPAPAIPLWDGRTAWRCAHALREWWVNGHAPRRPPVDES